MVILVKRTETIAVKVGNLTLGGNDNIYIFGLNTHEVEELWRNGYNSRDYYHTSPVLKGVIDRLYRPIGGQDFSHIADYLINAGYGVSDPFMCLADFESYMYAYKTAIKTIDQGVAKGILHKNAAARKKSQLTKKLNAAQ